MKKKLLLLFISCTLIFTSGSFSFATTEKSGLESEETIVTESDLNLTKQEDKNYKNYQQGMADEVKGCVGDGGDSKDIEKTLINYIDENKEKNAVTQKIGEATNITDDKELMESENLIDSNVMDAYTDIFEIDEDTDLIITPTTIYLDELEVTPGEDIICNEEDTEIGSLTSKIKNIFIEPVYAASWKTVSAAAKRTLYTSIGKAAASVHTGGKFKYNGSQARYHSNFYGYYNLYYTTYKNLSFDKVKETSGNSYQFYAYGVFCKFLKGQISGKSKKISCKIKCSPSGKITKSYYPALS